MFMFLWLFPVKKNKVFFCSFHGGAFRDNPKYIAMELAKLKEQHEFIWAIKKGMDSSSFPDCIKVVNVWSLQYFYHLATARIWVDDNRKSSFIRKRKSQYYIQTWHGSIGLKKIEYDVDRAQCGKLYCNYYDFYAKNDTRMTDLMISNSKFCTNLYRRAFAYKGEILLAGTPKLDLLLSCTDAERERLKLAVGMKKDAHILLYAPTFRVDHSLEPYQLDYARLRRSLTRKFGGDWQILIRLHPIMTQHMRPVNFDYVRDMTSYPDIEELLCFTDMLITDYSSTMFEMAIARRPVLIYATDTESYVNDRGFYFPFDSLPFPTAKSNEELERVIENYDRETSLAATDYFMEKLDVHETGHASEIVADVIEQVIRGGKR